MHARYVAIPPPGPRDQSNETVFGDKPGRGSLVKPVTGANQTLVASLLLLIHSVGESVELGRIVQP